MLENVLALFGPNEALPKLKTVITKEFWTSLNETFVWNAASVCVSIYSFE
jgi:hypothetical protein